VKFLSKKTFAHYQIRIGTSIWFHEVYTTKPLRRISSRI